MLPSIRAVSLALFISVIAAAQTAFPIPTIYPIYTAPNGTIFDSNSGELPKTTVSRAAVEEAVRRRPELQALWDRRNPPHGLAICRDALPRAHAHVHPAVKRITSDYQSVLPPAISAPGKSPTRST
jgi:hypothetical protein